MILASDFFELNKLTNKRNTEKILQVFSSNLDKVEFLISSSVWLKISFSFQHRIEYRPDYMSSISLVSSTLYTVSLLLCYYWSPSINLKIWIVKNIFKVLSKKWNQIGEFLWNYSFLISYNHNVFVYILNNYIAFFSRFRLYCFTFVAIYVHLCCFYILHFLFIFFAWFLLVFIIVLNQ